MRPACASALQISHRESSENRSKGIHFVHRLWGPSTHDYHAISHVTIDIPTHARMQHMSAHMRMYISARNYNRGDRTIYLRHYRLGRVSQLHSWYANRWKLSNACQYKNYKMTHSFNTLTKVQLITATTSQAWLTLHPCGLQASRSMGATMRG